MGSTLVSLGEWLRWYLDRPLLKVKVSSGFIYDASGRPDENKKIFFTASNPHSRPQTVNNFGLNYKKNFGTLMVNPQAGYQFPYQIDGGKSLMQWTDMNQVVSELLESNKVPRDLKGVWFASTTGKSYRGKIERYVMKELEAAIALRGKEA